MESLKFIRVSLLSLAFAVPVSAATLKDYLFESSAHGKLTLPQLDDSTFSSEKILTKSEIKKIKFFPMILKATAPLKVSRWQLVEVPLAFQMPQGRPTDLYYNTHLFWALDAQGKRLVGFRPVDTNTGCKSGCTPVVFHLQLDPSGKVLAILEERHMPLRKIGHAQFTNADREKALKLAQEFPAALKDIEKPDLIANSENVFPAQTWTAFQSVLVPGAAYTSYRIYEAALKTHDFLNAKTTELSQASQDQAMILSQILRSDTEDEVRKQIEILKAIIQDQSRHPAIRQMAYSIAPYLLLWLIQNENKIDRLAQKFFEGPEFSSSRLQTFCNFRKDLVYHEYGQKLLIEMKRRPRPWPTCDGGSTKVLPILAAGLLKERGKLRDYFKELGDFQIPEFVKSEAFLLSAYAQSLSLLDKRDELLRVAAELSVRFPNSAKIEEFRDEELLRFEEHKALSERAYREELRRGFQTEREKFPVIQAQENFGKKELKLPLKGSERLYIFFGSWCPHCQKTLTHWVSHVPSNLWNKISLVEIFRDRSNADTKAFCEQTALSPDQCKKIIYLPSSTRAPGFYRELALASVPRLVFVDSKQRIAIFDQVFAESQGSDLARDLQWIFEEMEIRPREI